MSDHPTSEQPTHPGVSAARPAMVGTDEPYGGSDVGAADRDVARRRQWVPLVSGPAYTVLLGLGVIAGIAGPILLWLNIAHKNTPLYQRVGLLVILIGLGLVLIALPLLLGEALRVSRVTSGDAGPDQLRGMTGARMFAVVAVVVLLAGAFLMHPASSPVNTGGGSSQGGGGRGGGGQGG